MFNYIYMFLLLLILFSLIYYYFYSGWGIKLLGLVEGYDNWVNSFECGFISHGFNENVFSYTFLNLLVIFIIFDLEISLLLNLPFQGCWFDNYLYYLIFTIILCIGYAIEAEKGYVNWSF